jgi:hypothetical protein
MPARLRHLALLTALLLLAAVPIGVDARSHRRPSPSPAPSAAPSASPAPTDRPTAAPTASASLAPSASPDAVAQPSPSPSAGAPANACLPLPLDAPETPGCRYLLGYTFEQAAPGGPLVAVARRLPCADSLGDPAAQAATSGGDNCSFVSGYLVDSDGERMPAPLVQLTFVSYLHDPDITPAPPSIDGCPVYGPGDKLLASVLADGSFTFGPRLCADGGVWQVSLAMGTDPSGQAGFRLTRAEDGSDLYLSPTLGCLAPARHGELCPEREPQRVLLRLALPGEVGAAPRRESGIRPVAPPAARPERVREYNPFAAAMFYGAHQTYELTALAVAIAAERTRHRPSPVHLAALVVGVAGVLLLSSFVYAMKFQRHDLRGARRRLLDGRLSTDDEE